MQAGRYGISFDLLNGRSLAIKPGAGDSAVAGVFGKALLAIVRDAIARKVFSPLRLRDDCQLEVLEFDWMWEWPKELGDLGRKNIVRKLRAASALSHNDFRVNRLQFDASVADFELPVHAALPDVAALVPCGCFRSQ